MVNKPKGFGTKPSVQQRSQPRKKTNFGQKGLTQDVELTLPKETECLSSKEHRLRSIFPKQENGPTALPEVSSESLQNMYQFLQEQLQEALVLVGKEPLPWEISHIYGIRSPQEHYQLRKRYPSYLDQYQLTEVSDRICPQTGIQIQVNRIEDQQSFELPLSNVIAQTPGTEADQAIADYQYWWQEYQPKFP